MKKSNISITGYKKDSPDRFNNYNIIPSRNITMKGIPYPIMGIDNFGNQQMMMPEGEYQFPGNMVTEYPMMHNTNNTNLKQNTMKLPNGYHLMPDGSLMSNEEMNYRNGGSSNAPQNADIDSIGNTRIKLMENLLKNNMNTHLQKEAMQQMQQMQMSQYGYAYGGQNDRSQIDYDALNQYNSNMNTWNNRADQRNSDMMNMFGAMTGTFAQGPYQQPIQQYPQARPQATNNPASMSQLGYNNAPEGTSWGMNQAGQESSFAPGANPFAPAAYMYGGNLPIAQKGLNFNVPNPHMTPELIAKYKKENPNIPMWGEMEGSNDPATGYWNRVKQDWSKPWGIAGWEEDKMYADPRMIKALKNIIPFTGDSMGPLDYLNNLWTMPQKGINKFLTGYYESPMTTSERYNNQLDPTMKFVGDVATDPMMWPELPYAGGKALYKGAAKVAPHVTKAAKVVANETKKAAIYVADKLGPYVREYAPIIISRVLQATSHLPQDSEQKQEILDREIAKEIKRLNLVPQNILPSSTIQAPQAPRPQQVIPTGYTNPNMAKMTPEQLAAITGVKRYGGDALPMAQYGDIPLMQQPYYSDEARAYAARLQADAKLQSMVNVPQYTSPFVNNTDEQRQLIEEQRIKTAGEQALVKAKGKVAANNADTGSTSTGTSPAKKDEKVVVAEDGKPGENTKPEKTKGNDMESDDKPAGDKSSNETNYYDTRYNQGYNQGYPGGTKIKSMRWQVDPKTGKRELIREKIKVPNSYATWNVNGQNVPMPRKVKIDYYNNPQFNQLPGPYARPDGQPSGPYANEQFPDTPNYEINVPQIGGFPQGQTGFGEQGNQWYQPTQFDAGTFNPTNNFNLRNPLPEGYDYINNQEPMINPADYDTAPNDEYYARDPSQESTPNRIRRDRRFQREVARDDRQRGFQTGGALSFQQGDISPYEKMMQLQQLQDAARVSMFNDASNDTNPNDTNALYRDVNNQWQPVSMVQGQIANPNVINARRVSPMFYDPSSPKYQVGGGWAEADPFNNVPMAFKDPIGAASGDYNAPQAPTGPYAMTDKGDWGGRDKIKQTGPNNFGNALLQNAVPIGHGIASIIEGWRDTQPKAPTSDELFTSVDRFDMGYDTVNAGKTRPNALTPTQFQGQGYLGQYGGNFQMGGQSEPMYLSDEEIKQVMAMGGQIEYL